VGQAYEEEPDPVGHEAVFAHRVQPEVRLQFAHALFDDGFVAVFGFEHGCGLVMIVGDEDPVSVRAGLERRLFTDRDRDAFDDVATERAAVAQPVAELGDLAGVIVEARIPVFIAKLRCRRRGPWGPGGRRTRR
jgi:hypothetical protein